MIQEGTLILIETGEYSDYGVAAVVRVKKGFDGKDAIEQYLSERPDQKDQYRGDHYEFIQWLSKNDYIEDAPHLRWHIGSYSTLSYEEPR
jgi:hypothetical protein